MKQFIIKHPDERIIKELQNKIDNLTKPKGSLGMLEKIALQIGWIQQSLTPTLCKPTNVIFAGDHGISVENVSISPKEVTWQQCLHFMRNQGGGINFLCRQHQFELKVVDSGVDYDFSPDSGIIDKKMAHGTRNFLHEAAIAKEDMESCLERGAEIVREVNANGCNIISFGEMGVGNTSASSLWMTCLTNIPLLQCVGAGSGLSNEGIRHKYHVLKHALDHYRGNRSTFDVMTYFGGYEMVMAVGAMLQAAELSMTILVDGFIMTVCMLAAIRLYPEVKTFAIFCHCSDENGHKLLLDAINARPLLNLDLRLGEGSGAVCAYPIIDSAIRMINEMDSFDKGKITKYF